MERHSVPAGSEAALNLMKEGESLMFDKKLFHEAELKYREALAAVDALPQARGVPALRAGVLASLTATLVQQHKALEALDVSADAVEAA